MQVQCLEEEKRSQDADSVRVVMDSEEKWGEKGT